MAEHVLIAKLAAVKILLQEYSANAEIVDRRVSESSASRTGTPFAWVAVPEGLG